MTKHYAGFHILRPCAIIAAIFGIIQSLAWIGFSIVAIIAYFCSLNFSGFVSGGLNLSDIFPLTFFEMYFRGSCEQPPDFPELNFGPLRLLNLMDIEFIFGMMWLYLILSSVWLASSILLIVFVQQKYIRRVNVFLYFWIAVTLTITFIDIAMGIFFAIDLDKLSSAVASIALPGFTIEDQILVTAQAVSSIMLVMSFRGFIFFVINAILAIYLFIETFKIYDYNSKTVPVAMQMKSGTVKAGMVNPAFLNNETNNQDLDAFNPQHYFYPPGTGIPRPVVEKSVNRSTSVPSAYDNRNSHRNSNFQSPQSVANNPARNKPNWENEVVLRRDVANVTREIRSRNSMNQTRPFNKQHIPAPDYDNVPKKINQYERQSRF